MLFFWEKKKENRSQLEGPHPGQKVGQVER